MNIITGLKNIPNNLVPGFFAGKFRNLKSLTSDDLFFATPYRSSDPNPYRLTNQTKTAQAIVNYAQHILAEPLQGKETLEQRNQLFLEKIKDLTAYIYKNDFSMERGALNRDLQQRIETIQSIHLDVSTHRLYDDREKSIRNEISKLFPDQEQKFYDDQGHLKPNTLKLELDKIVAEERRSTVELLRYLLSGR
jgi:hypothetical protein